MKNDYNLDSSELAVVESMSEEELLCAARRMPGAAASLENRNYDALREAVCEALADGYTIEDFCL